MKGGLGKQLRKKVLKILRVRERLERVGGAQTLREGRMLAGWGCVMPRQ